MSPWAQGYPVQRYLAPIGIIIPHACQHTFTLRALRGGSDLVAVSKPLGHALVATTRAYLDHLAMEALRAALPDLPLGGRS